MPWLMLIAAIAIIYIVIKFWYFFASLIVLGIVSYLIYRYGFFLPKIKKIKTSDAIFIPGEKIYVVPLVVENQKRKITGSNNKKTEISEWIVNSIEPRLNNGQLELNQVNHKIDKVKLVDNKNKDSELQTILQIATPIKDLINKIQPHIIEFQQKIIELQKSQKLALSSDVYSSQAELYARAIKQLQELIKKEEERKVKCSKFVREILIGKELARFNPDSLPDITSWRVTFDSEYQSINEKYELLKEEIKAYEELRK